MSLSLLSALLTLSACTSPTPPPPPPPPPPPDTTSHDFVWRIDTLGDGNSSILYDVAIIDENNIWAVGEIYLRDSSGGIDPTAYNLARWNGSTWNLVSVPLMDFGGASFGFYPIRAILAFAANDVWVAGAGGLAHFDGQAWGRWTLLFNDLNDNTFGETNKMWGPSSDNIYIVGNRGSITHFNGTTWSRIESGTTLDLNDVWGGTSVGTPQVMGIAVGRQGDVIQSRLLSIAINGVVSLPDRPGLVTSLWFVPGRLYVAVGDGIFTKASDTSTSWQGAPLQITTYFSHRVRGTDVNNVMVVGSFGDMLHYNGSTWRQYPQLRGNGNYLSVSAAGRLVAAVGEFGGRARVTIGFRQ